MMSTTCRSCPANPDCICTRVSAGKELIEQLAKEHGAEMYSDITRYGKRSYFEITTDQLEAFAKAYQALPDGVLKAIDNYGLTLLKTANGYELRKLGKAVAYQATAPIDNGIAEALEKAAKVAEKVCFGRQTKDDMGSSRWLEAGKCGRQTAQAIRSLIPDTQANRTEG
jgi:hypothetical protein